MKNISFVLILAALVAMVSSCKKESAKKPATTAAATATSNISQSLTGKWYVAKDSVQTLDYTSVLPNLVHPPAFTGSDFITFNTDSTIAISTTAAFSAFYTDYQASNTDSKLQVITNIIPILKSPYQISLQGYSIPSSSSNSSPQPVYALSIQHLTALSGAGYSISMPDSKTLILSHTTEIPTLQHDFRIKESVYLHK